MPKHMRAWGCSSLERGDSRGLILIDSLGALPVFGSRVGSNIDISIQPRPEPTIDQSRQGNMDLFQNPKTRLTGGS